MKKINVQKLVELMQKKAENEKEQQFTWEMIAKCYKIYETKCQTLAELHREITADIKAESVKLDEAIKTAEGRATARTVNAQEVAEALAEVINFFGISKKAMKGTKVLIDCNAQKFPNAYKWTPQSTIIIAEFTASGWCVTDVYRGASRSKKHLVLLSDTAKEAYLTKAETLGE